MTTDAPVVIVGAGLAGSAAAWALARRGRPVVVLDRYAVGHRLGSSHGSARIVRRAYTDPLYSRLTGEAFELWDELSDAAQLPLVRMLGGIDFGARRDIPALAAHLAAAGVAHEVLPAREAQARWPGMVFAGEVVFHEQAGTMDADAAVRAMLTLAAGDGAVVRPETEAVTVHRNGDGARVLLADGSALEASHVVVAAGAWVGPLLDGVLELPRLRVTEQRVLHFPRRDRAAAPWPSVIHDDDWAVYHLAGGHDGGTGDDRKLGVHDGGVPAVPGSAGVVPDDARDWATDYVRRWLPGLDPSPRGEATCLYTSTPSEDFVLDRVGPLVVCSACSGHGAKFAPLLGELVARLVDGAGDVPERFALASHLRGLPGSVSL